MNRSLHTVPELVAFALFDLDPRVKQAKLPLYDFMVSLALYEADEAMTETELVKAVGELLPVGASVAGEQIHVAVDAHADLGLIDRNDAGELRLSPLRYGQLEDARSRLAVHRTAFHDHMLGTVTERTALSGDEAAALYEALEDRLQELLRAQSSTLAGAWAGGGDGFDAALQELNAREHLKEVANRVAPGGAQPNAVRRTALALGLEIGLRTLPADAAAYLGALYQRTVAFALLEQDPSIRRVKSQLASQRVAYLDTNVVMAAMFDADHEHDLACQVIELTRTLGADLRVTRFTVEELTRRLGDANRWMTRYRGDASLRAVVDDVVVRSYHRATRTSPALRWGAFIGGFDPPDAWLAEHGVTIERDHCQETEQDRRVDQARSAVARHRSLASDRVLQTDALNLVHVDRVRRNLASDEMGNRAWFVTFDRALPRADRYLVEHTVFGHGVTRLSQGWVDLLSPCLPPDNEQLSAYVTHLVQSQFSLLAEDPMFVNKDFLLTITRSRFDVASLLDTTPERARQILIRLQQEEELQTLLGEPQPDSDDWNARLAEVVSRALAELEQSPEQMAALAAQQQARVAAERRADDERKGRLLTTRELAEAQAVAERLVVERDELSEELQRERSLPWWKRLFRRSNNR